MIKHQDLNDFQSFGFGYLGHENRSPASDENLVIAANQLDIGKEDLELWCDSGRARHRMDQAGTTAPKAETFRAWLGKDIPIIKAE